MATVLPPTGRWNLIRPIDQPLGQGAGQNANIIRANYFPINPEAYFPGPDHGIPVNLVNVLRATNPGPGGIIASQLQFQGVLVRDSPQDYEEGEWYTAPWDYQIPLSLNWNSTQGTRVFQIEVNNYPFEWLSFEVYTAAGTPYTASDLFAISFTDSTDNELMDRPILQRAVNRVGGWRAQFPTLPVVYPLNSGIQYTIQSLVDPADPSAPYTFTLVFKGQRRLRKKR